MPGTPNSALPEGNLGHPWDASSNDVQDSNSATQQDHGAAIAGSSNSTVHSTTQGRPSNAVTSFDQTSLSRTAPSQSHTALLTEPLNRSWSQSASKSSIRAVRKRSDHSGRIYKALLILAIAVTAVSLLPGSSDSDDTIGSRPAPVQDVDAGSPDAPPPDVLIQGD